MYDSLSIRASDRDSIYSFDSVSTSERLLDRLDFDNESIASSNRDSIYQRDNNIRLVNAANALNQYPMNNLSAITKLRGQMSPSLQQRNVSAQFPYQIAPTERDKTSFNPRTTSKLQPEPRQRGGLDANPARLGDTNLNHKKIATKAPHNKHLPSKRTVQEQQLRSSTAPPPHLSSKSNTKSLSSDSVNTIKTVTAPEPYNNSKASSTTRDLPTKRNYSSDSTVPTLSSLSLGERNHKPHVPYQHQFLSQTSSRVPLTPTSSRSSDKENDFFSSNNSSEDSLENTALVNVQTSGSGSGSVSNYSHHTHSKSQEIAPESRVVIAMELRAINKHREASYQLQIAANDPYNYPKAMYLYAIALKHGQGVKQNFASSMKWLCKCILISSLSSPSSSPSSSPPNQSLITSKLNKLASPDLLKLIITNLASTNNTDLYYNGTNVESLYLLFKGMNKTQISKIMAANKNKTDVLALSYFELGSYLCNGWVGGTSSPTLAANDEANGIACLSKAGSMGNVEAMETLGEIYTTKSKNRKKDLAKAAAWLRSCEVFGVKSIGNSWIYKEKFVKLSL
ncbi:uncharacterized protein LODBEIA_P05980 [Lodderomyces beijingensis]|uniref:Protein DSF2 n=1 Tax=Lodderomyces beijingensis TaxID=1775926 RepID=A0ABP0ZDW5_9ASCO